jgi:CBS domain containing-hemolysin-like protein
MADSYLILADHPLAAGAVLMRRTETADHRVTAASPALEAMTDLAQVDAVRIAPGLTIDMALERMRAAGVRLLFVNNPADEVIGVITLSDIQGEKPVRFQHDMGVGRGEVLVRDIMTPREQVDALQFDDVQRARVGDVVATLRHLGRQHALVVERVGGRERIRGLFSTSRIGRQLGTPLEFGETAHTFAEIGTALRS